MTQTMIIVGIVVLYAALGWLSARLVYRLVYPANRKTTSDYNADENATIAAFLALFFWPVLIPGALVYRFANTGSFGDWIRRGTTYEGRTR